MKHGISVVEVELSGLGMTQEEAEALAKLTAAETDAYVKANPKVSKLGKHYDSYSVDKLYNTNKPAYNNLELALTGTMGPPDPMDSPLYGAAFAIVIVKAPKTWQKIVTDITIARNKVKPGGMTAADKKAEKELKDKDIASKEPPPVQLAPPQKTGKKPKSVADLPQTPAPKGPLDSDKVPWFKNKKILLAGAGGLVALVGILAVATSGGPAPSPAGPLGDGECGCGG